ncbi:hypothetical protein, partial [uncultured Dysosmobacter sp.]|uniref:DUF7601 domain-containing protein n=1 Tax=uncultured Dysosmobacter sp. TaxID=2591384 RepID=UPI002631210F
MKGLKDELLTFLERLHAKRALKSQGRRALALALCGCMVLSLCGGILTPAVHADTRSAEPTDDIVDGSRVADPDTMDDYQFRLLTETTGSRYAGRVWTDKTVFASGDSDRADDIHFNGEHTITLNMEHDGYTGEVKFNSDFAHVFSALASSQVVNEYPPSPVDLVIVFDMSGSMGQDTRYEIDPGGNYYVAHTKDGTANGESHGDGFPEAGVPMAERIANSRIQTTLNAINTTIDKLMAQNPQNRVAVCGYGANAVVLMPLGHYKRAVVDGVKQDYLTVGGMETLYHASDLVYRSPGDDVKKNGVKLDPVTTEGWYWMNNRDTCYTVVVNAQYNTYTGVLNKTTGDATGVPNDEKVDGYKWKDIKKTVSNNVLNNVGEHVHAFPGAWENDGTTPKADFSTQSINVYQGSSDVTTSQYWCGADLAAALDDGSNLSKAMILTSGLEAEDYVGYFTNTQGGIYLAYKQLADSKATTYTETLSNGVVSTVARIPAAIIMSDGGANFSFNEMGNSATEEFTVKDWNGRYGQRTEGGTGFAYLTDDSIDWNHIDESPSKGYPLDVSHRLNDNTGDEWYKVYLPGNDTLAHGDNPVDSKGYWNGLHGIYNSGADIYKDGTLTLPPTWNKAGVFYSSDNSPVDAPGTILEVLLTAAYMHDVVKTHYNNGWTADGATEESKSDLFTYTMNVDTKHVPQWGKMRLYPTLDPKDYPLDTINSAKWYTKAEQFGDEDLADSHKLTEVYNDLYQSWNQWKTDGETQATIANEDNTKVQIKSIAKAGTNDADYETKLTKKDGTTQDDTIHVTDEAVIANIAYNDGFYDVTSSQLGETFDTILGLILGKVFVPVSGDNDAGVGDSITYQDPIGEYMEIKNEAIIATPHHVDDPNVGMSGPQTYDMSLLVFGEMHGLVRAGVYDWHWNDQWMQLNDPTGTGTRAFKQGWYKGEPKANQKALAGEYIGKDADGSSTYPIKDPDTGKEYSSAQEARDDGWVMRFNFETLLNFVPITGVDNPNVHPSELPAQVQNTVYTCYRFAGSQEDRNELRRNPIYGDGVPEELQEKWDKYKAEGKYPVGDSEYAGTPGVYRLSDIRVWVEDTGDFVDTDGAIAPNSGYDRSLYVNIPAAAIPTELATITLGPDGVLSYETNLGKDHKVGDKITVEEGGETVTKEVTDEIHQNFCYQSTPFRLFYAVGLEDDLILRDEDGNQAGVDFNAISPEYISSHTVEGQDYVWFISNFYSGTRYGDYATDTVSRTRGDPTVTFSPGADNRYYVFQKPLPLFAHAYRWDGSNLKAVDNNDGKEWTKDNNRAGNGKTTWEEYNGQQQASSWVGGQFMGVYSTQTAFSNALRDATWDDDGKQYIKDSHGGTYEVVDGGIIFSEEDLLDHVTTNEDGTTAPGSHSFSSDDYYFILLEFYVPYKGTTGVDDKGEEVPGTQAGHMVQYAIARKGSEFGSGYVSSKINNGDMLCWTDTANKLNVEFAYVSMSDTGDRTRGEPTFEKLTYKKGGEPGKNLEDYLKSIGLSDEKQVPNPKYDPTIPADPKTNPETIGALTQQVEYWTAVQEDPLVQAALSGIETAEQFKERFKFAVATRPGGVRSGDMSNNRQLKTDNTTQTAYNYYLPTISDNSGTDNDVIIDNFLGNNGRLEIANQTLHVTKMLVPPEGYTLTDDQEKEEFNFQVSIQGVTGTRTAVKTEYNEYAGNWERELAYIDVLTDNSDLVLTNDSTRALFVLEETDSTLEGGSKIPIAKQVVQGSDGWYYANDDGTQSEKKVEQDSPNLYYMYLPSNGAPGTDAAHVHRLYQNEDYKEDAENFPNLAESKNGTTTFVDEAHKDEITDPVEGTTDSYRPASDMRPAGTKTYWVQNAELIPKDEVDIAEGVNDVLMGTPGEPGGISTIAAEAVVDGAWVHDDGEHGDSHKELTFHTFVIRKPGSATDSTTNFSSPYKTRTQYMTVTLEFGENANKNDGGINGPGTELEEADLYNKDRFGTLGDDYISRLLRITAEFTLRHGEGLMFSGLSGSQYKFVEKLTDDQVAKGYKLQKIEHVQQLTTDEYTDRTTVTGDTGDGEEQVNYTNTFQPGDISITKKLDAQEGTTITDDDRKTEFTFTLKITPSGIGAPEDGTYSYTITDEDDKTVKTGRLLPMGTTEGVGDNDIVANSENLWTFKLKGGQTMTVNDLPVKSGYTYTVTENPHDGFDSDGDPENDG